MTKLVYAKSEKKERENKHNINIYTLCFRKYHITMNYLILQNEMIILDDVI